MRDRRVPSASRKDRQRGLRGPRKKVLGFAIAGRIESVDRGVSKFRPGDEVYAEATESGVLSRGGFAEYVSVSEDALARKPSNLTFEQAAAVPVVGVAALQALRDIGRVQPGQHVLINGASGGVGTFAVQIAKAFRAEVTGVTSTGNVELVRSIGADHVVDYTRKDFTRSSRRYDLILDNVGNRKLSECLRVLTPKGTLIPNSNRGGDRWLGRFIGRAVQALLLSPFVSQRIRPFGSTGKGEDLAVLTELIEAGRVTPVIDSMYPLDQSAEALNHYGQGHTRGKIVITFGAEETRRPDADVSAIALERECTRVAPELRDELERDVSPSGRGLLATARHQLACRIAPRQSTWTHAMRGRGTCPLPSVRPGPSRKRAQATHADRASTSNSRRPMIGMFASTSPAPSGDAISTEIYGGADAVAEAQQTGRR